MLLIVVFTGESEEFLKRAKIVVPQTAAELDDVFLQQRQFHPPEGGGCPKASTPEKTKEQQAAANAATTQKIIAEAGINVPVPKPEKKAENEATSGDKKPAAKKSPPKKSPPKSSPKPPPPTTTTMTKAQTFVDDRKRMAVQSPDKSGDVDSISDAMEFISISESTTKTDFRCGRVVMEDAFDDPIFVSDGGARTRMAVLVYAHSLSGCDGNEVNFNI